jgi:hypothetical protein
MPPRSFIPPILALAAICATSVYKLAVQPRVDEIPVGFAEAALVQKTHINGTPLRTRYTAVAPIDFLLSMLVVVFAPGVAGWDSQYRLQQIYFVGQVFAICCVWTVEAHRASYRRRVIR